MRMLFVFAAGTLAAAGLLAAPAQSQSLSADNGFPSGPIVSLPADFGSQFSDGKGDRRRHRRGGNVVVLSDGGWNDAWALYNNRGWDSGSYNDWWHDRPDRAYPRWMQNNQNCERTWWGGGAWRC